MTKTEFLFTKSIQYQEQIMVIELSGVIWAEIIRVISKSNERAARVRFEITSMISDQN